MVSWLSIKGRRKTLKGNNKIYILFLRSEFASFAWKVLKWDKYLIYHQQSLLILNLYTQGLID